MSRVTAGFLFAIRGLVVITAFNQFGEAFGLEQEVEVGSPGSGVITPEERRALNRGYRLGEILDRVFPDSGFQEAATLGG
jgi:hypothetical protein